MTNVIQQALSLLRHPLMPTAAVAFLALLFCLARHLRGKGKALDGGRTLSVGIIIAALAVLCLTWGSSNPSLPLLMAAAAIIVPTAFAWKQDKDNAVPPSVGNMLTIEKYEERLEQQLRRVFQEEQKRQDVEQKLLNLKQSYEEELKRSKEQEDALAHLQGQLPEAQIEKAQADLRQGNKEAAKQAFAAVRQEAGRTAALAAYHGGQIAKEELEYAEAMRLHKDAVTLEPDNPDYLLAAGQMAYKMGDYQQAEEWLEHLLAIREQEGKEDANLALTLNEVALAYDSQGRYEEAEPLFKRSLQIREQKLGKDHPDTAESLNNLAGLYRAQGNYEEAEPLYQQAIAIMKKKFPGGHPNIDVIQKNYDELKKKMQERQGHSAP